MEGNTALWHMCEGEIRRTVLRQAGKYKPKEGKDVIDVDETAD